MAPAAENLNTLYMYNYIRGKLRDIAGSSDARPVLNLYYSSGSVPEGDALYFRDSSNNAVNFLSASRESTGVYKASFSVTGGAVTTTYPYLVDVWTMSGSELHTGSVIVPSDYGFSDYNPNSKYVVNVKNLKKKYTRGQTERFRLYVREKNWSPNIYTVAKATPKNTLIESASYQISRLSDKKVVIPYGTGSTAETMLSYDSDGNYFDLDMDLLEAGYTYELKLSFYEDSISSYREQPYTFKIRVEQNGIKSLFNKTTTIESAASSSVLVESSDFVNTKMKVNAETFQPYIDFSDPANFAKFGLAEEYYKLSIERIHDYYPYDGSDEKSF